MKACQMRSNRSSMHWRLPYLLLLCGVSHAWATFGNEYVHIKVHVPKEQAPVLVEAEPQKVIHHFHHHARARARHSPPPPPPPPHLLAKHKVSPLLESVILSDLDKPLHTSEHADYLNHAKELADHLTESYAKKAPPPKKKINTYTVIEELHRSPLSNHEFEHLAEAAPHNVDTYRVIETHPSHSHPHHFRPSSHAHKTHDNSYHYPAPSRHQRPKLGAYAEPAPVEESADTDQDYFAPAVHSYGKTRTPTYTLQAPDQAAGSHYGSSHQHSFRPSPQLPSEPEVYDDEDTYAPQHQSDLDWPEPTGYNSDASETYNGLDSYSVGHVQGKGSSGYQYKGPYAP